MADLKKFQEVLRSRFKMKALVEESDLIYKIEDSELEDVINLGITAHNPKYTLQTLPAAEEPFILWLAEIELLYMFASANARFFSISASGASVNKQERVQHYLSIIDRLQKKYDSAWERFLSLNPEQIEVGEVFINNAISKGRTKRLAKLPTIELVAVRQTENSVDLQWNYISHLEPSVINIWQSKSLIVDEWEEPIWYNGVQIPVMPDSMPIFRTNNRFRDKFRAKNLEAGTLYNFAAIIVDKGNRWKHHEIKVTTNEG